MDELNPTVREQEIYEEMELTPETVSYTHLIEDLKLQKAIDKGNELIQDSRYSNLSKESRRKIKQYLLYC